MRVEKLELAGFKSFGDRVVFNLHSGITCIVGPNGCGKSNVVDSFKWVLGEQSAKSLRGARMEEVIFAGSQNKKPKGMAEVSLTISGLANSGSSGNGKDAITTVARRLYRSGDSDYILNKNSCRLRDIKDIFLDTGLEMKSYSILEQDRISAILAAKPDERRFIIEEVAGVVKYKVRRNEAQNKLESSRNNLQRITDITNEIRRQINSLDRQVKKAERYKRLMSELKEVELRLARHEFDRLSQEHLQTQTSLTASREEDAALRAELNSVEAEIETRRIRMLEKEKSYEVLQGELQTVEREMSETQRTLAVSATEKQNRSEYIGKLKQQIEENQQKLEQGKQRKQEIAGMVQVLQDEIVGLQRQVDDQNTMLKTVESEISDKEQLLDTRRRESVRASQDLGELRNLFNRHSASFDALSGRQSANQSEITELQKYTDEIARIYKELQQDMLNKNGILVELKEKRQTLAAQIETLTTRLVELRESTGAAREELASLSSRLDSLNEMAVTESSEEDLKDAVLILGNVSDLIQVDKQYERAVESALREAISGFLVEGQAEIKSGIAALRAKELGRTAFIAKGSAPRFIPSGLPAGALARASEVVTASPEMQNMVASLLGPVVIVKDLDTALSMNCPETVVTLEGEVVEPTGVVIAGKSKGILSLKREMRELSSDIASKRMRLKRLEGEAEQSQKNMTDMEADLSQVDVRVVEFERELSILRLKAERNDEDMERSNRKLSMLRIEADQIGKQREELQVNINSSQEKIASAEQGIKNSEISMTEINGQITQKKIYYEQKRSDTVDVRLKLTTGNERLNSLRSEDTSASALIHEFGEKEQYIRNEIAQAEDMIRQGDESAGKKEQWLAGLALKADDKSTRMNQKRSEMNEESEVLREMQISTRARRVKIDESSQRLSELDIRRAEHELRLENLTGNMKNTYDIELGDHQAGPIEDGDLERQPELKQKIERIGPVSLGSIEEYEELKERYDFQTKQQEDLIQAIAELEEAIKRINSTTRQRLREAYDQLKVKFAEVFEELFGGGKAELILTDPSNILETGIDVVAQPPGKRFQNINLLSGGEKTLTALALLFASFLIKPSPICILDEADAALDESNTMKFAQMLKQLSENIQFIVVTHNRVTMEVADYIYGVTMQEPGNSKIISMKLTEAAEVVA